MSKHIQQDHVLQNSGRPSGHSIDQCAASDNCTRESHVGDM
ncbi:MAG TPA: hypothetical protein VHC19_07545 [Pirellulales bacterium]|nr:hypothetical protein [Pirellulales bacterium]